VADNEEEEGRTADAVKARVVEEPLTEVEEATPIQLVTNTSITKTRILNFLNFRRHHNLNQWYSNLRDKDLGPIKEDGRRLLSHKVTAALRRQWARWPGFSITRKTKEGCRRSPRRQP